MSTRCRGSHSLVSDIRPVTNPQGVVEFVSDFPDMVIGKRDTEALARSDAIAKAKTAAVKFCASKSCPVGTGCIWKDINRRFQAIAKYSTPGVGWFAVLNIKYIECKCKKLS